MLQSRWILILVLSLLLTSRAHAQWQEKVTLTTHNLCPYGCYQLNSSNSKAANSHGSTKTEPSNQSRLSFTGVAVSVVSCAFKELKQPYEIVVVPWARAQKMVQTNQADGFFAASKQEGRDEYAVFSNIIADQKWQWYLLKDNPLNPKQSDFKEKAMVGGFIGANMLSWLENNDFQIAAKATNSEVLLQLLLRRRVDAILANNYVMDALIKQANAKNKIQSFVNKDKPLGVYFSKLFHEKHKDFLPAFNEKVLKCRNAS